MAFDKHGTPDSLLVSQDRTKLTNSATVPSQLTPPGNSVIIEGSVMKTTNQHFKPSSNLLHTL